ncbi:hypothetical protein KGQ19_48835, partial [Catenulispora sp. NL8]
MRGEDPDKTQLGDYCSPISADLSQQPAIPVVVSVVCCRRADPAPANLERAPRIPARWPAPVPAVELAEPPVPAPPVLYFSGWFSVRSPRSRRQGFAYSAGGRG